MDSKKPGDISSSTKQRVLRPNLILLFVAVSAFVVHYSVRVLTEYTLCTHHEQIYTVDDAQPRAHCMTIRNDRISRIGAYSYLEPKDKVALMSIPVPFSNWSLKIQRPFISFVEAADIIVPGLTDAHAHVLEYGWMMQLPLTGTASVQEVIERIKQYIQSHPNVLNDSDRWIEGMGWDQTKWESKKFPTAEDLNQDPLLKGRPISLTRVDGHARWVSPRVLDIMNTLPEDSEVTGGQIIRDVYGKPTGIFVDNAMDFIPSPAWSDQQMEEFFETTITTALKFGLTSIHDADTKLSMISFFKKKAEEGTIPLRLYLMGGVVLPKNGSESEITSYISGEWNHGVPRFINYGRQARLTLRAVKLFADGALGSWGAALLAPYSDSPTIQGTLLEAPKVLRAAVRRYFEDNMQVNIHCIGDKANRLALDIFQELIEEKAVNVSAWRPRIEHAQIIEEHDLERFGKSGVIASVQPTHATSDMWYAEERLGPNRIQGAYAYASLLRLSGQTILPLGSDFPIEGVNPLLGFYAAVKRLAIDGNSPHGHSGWYPNEKLTRKQALKGMTLDAAYASFQEHEIGSLQVGKKADFVIFDRDFVGCEDEEVCDGSEILEAKVRAVVIDGMVVWGKLPRSEIWKVIHELFGRLITHTIRSL